ncbi:MAG: hypothetical protein ACKVOH_02280 [Chlamydiales bacterium]
MWFFFLPFILQSIVIPIDEFCFHWRRGLPRWERIGHPLDTCTIILCFVFTLLFPYSRKMLLFFAPLALFSAFFVTKDEFVHKECCGAKEQWLHAILFLNHPLMLISAGFLWARGFIPFLAIQTALTTAFCIYQLIYWNVLWKPK